MPRTIITTSLRLTIENALAKGRSLSHLNTGLLLLASILCEGILSGIYLNKIDENGNALGDSLKESFYIPLFTNLATSMEHRNENIDALEVELSEEALAENDCFQCLNEDVMPYVKRSVVALVLNWKSKSGSFFVWRSRRFKAPVASEFESTSACFMCQENNCMYNG